MPTPANLVHQTSTTTGTGNLTLSTVNGKQSFSDAFGTTTSGTDIFDYFVSNQDAAEWERGTGHMSDSTTLVRDTVLESTNSDAAVNFSAGTKDIINDIPAENQGFALPGVNGLVIVNNSGTPNTQLDIDADTAILLNSTNNPVIVTSIDLTINASTTGANGLDTGSLTTNAWYHAYIIYNGSTTAGLVSTSATSPTMPSGYTYKYRVGAIRTDGSSVFYRTVQRGNRAQYTLVASTNTAAYRVMDSGSSGSVTTPTWTAIAVASFIPPTATAINILLRDDSLNMMASPNNAAGAFSSSTNPPLSVIDLSDGAISGTSFTRATEMILESSNIYWASSSSDADVRVVGWTDAVNAN